MALVLVVKMKRKGNILEIIGKIDYLVKKGRERILGVCVLNSQEDNYKMKYSQKY